MVVLTETKISREKQARLSYLDNPAAVGLLDVIAASIAEEFVERVRGKESAMNRTATKEMKEEGI